MDDVEAYDGLALPSPRVRAVCLIALVLVMAAVPFVFYYLIFAPSPWKTVIGEMKLGNGTELSVGRTHDGDIAYDYHVKVRGKHARPVAWTGFAGGVTPAEGCEMARTADSRFTGIAIAGDDARGAVIYDAVDDELWLGHEGDWRKKERFKRVWRELEKVNPRLAGKE